MATDLEQFATIRTQTLAVMADLTANPKPTYSLDGQSVSWDEYLLRLRQTVDWCDSKLATTESYELHSRGET